MASPPTKFLKASSDTGEVHGSVGDWQAPRLSRAVFNAPAGGTDDYRTKLEKAVNLPKDKGGRGPVTLQEQDPDAWKGELKALCDHLLERLKGSFDEAWMSIYGYNPHSDDFKKLVIAARKAGKTPSQQVSSSNAELKEMADFYDSGEEQWARAFCETFIYCMYHTPGSVYGGSDADWYKRFPRVFAVAVACQNLSTYCLLSRGFTLAQVSGLGLSCSAGSASVGAFEKSAGPPKKPFVKPMASPTTVTDADVPAATPEKDKKKTLAQLQQADLKKKGMAGDNLSDPGWANTQELTKAGATPGSVIIYNPGGSAFTGQDAAYTGEVTHMASVLRVQGKRLQFVDTGVVVGNGESSAESGTVDHEFLSGGLIHPRSVVAFGFAKPSDQGALITGADALRESKPVGLTRLVVVDADKQTVLFVSRLLHMRWPVSKLIWSLRAGGGSGGTPTLPFQGLVLAWLVWVPNGPSAVALANTLSGTLPPASTLITGPIRLANVVMSGNGGAVSIARSHLFSKWDNSKLPAIVRSWKLASGDPLIDHPAGTSGANNPRGWCDNQDNFGKCYYLGSVRDENVDHELLGP